MFCIYLGRSTSNQKEVKLDNRNKGRTIAKNKKSGRGSQPGKFPFPRAKDIQQVHLTCVDVTVRSTEGSSKVNFNSIWLRAVTYTVVTRPAS